MRKPRSPGSHYAALVDMMREIGVAEGRDPEAGVQIAADFVGVNHFTLRKQLDPDQDGEMTFHRVSLLTTAFRVPAAAQHLAHAAGGVFVPVVTDDETGKMGELTAELAEETGQALATIMRALSPKSAGGRDLTPAETRETVKELDDIIRIVVMLRALAIAGGKGA